MAFDYEGAIKEGYTDSDIATHLAGKSGFDLPGALKEGYSYGDIAAHLSKGGAKVTPPTIPLSDKELALVNPPSDGPDIGAALKKMASATGDFLSPTSSHRAMLTALSSMGLAPGAALVSLAQGASTELTKPKPSLAGAFDEVSRQFSDTMNFIPQNLLRNQDDVQMLEALSTPMDALMFPAKGLKGLAELPTGGLKGATDVIEGRSGGSNIAVPFVGTAAEAGTLYSLPKAFRKLEAVLGKKATEYMARKQAATPEIQKQIESIVGEKPFPPEDIIDITAEPAGPGAAERLLIDLKEAKQRGRVNAAQPPAVIQQGVDRPLLPPPKTPTDVADFLPSEESAIIEDVKGFPVQQVKVSDIKAKPEELQFKLDVNASGVQEPLKGDYNELAAGNLLLWQAKNGNLYVANGHHRLGLAKRKDIETVNAQVLREKDGFADSSRVQHP
jgi:hypothetical protein